MTAWMRARPFSTANRPATRRASCRL